MSQELIIDNVKVYTNEELSEEEIKAYLARAEKGKVLKSIDIEIDGEFANIHYYYAKPFERIRRITGYLVGSVDRWNDSKKAELKDRVKHSQI